MQTLETRLKRSKSLMNERNGSWKGDKVGYNALHDWVRRRKVKPKCCKRCHRKNVRLELANISGKYKRDVNDYEYLCVRCHMRTEKRVIINQHAKKTHCIRGHKLSGKNIYITKHKHYRMCRICRRIRHEQKQVQ